MRLQIGLKDKRPTSTERSQSAARRQSGAAASVDQQSWDREIGTTNGSNALTNRNFWRQLIVRKLIAIDEYIVNVCFFSSEHNYNHPFFLVVIILAIAYYPSYSILS